MLIATTSRLRVRQFQLDDAAFVLELVNEPPWLEFIGDRQVHDLTGALAYLRNGPMAMYAEHGLGLYLVERIADGLALGMCGLLKRDTLEDVDIGFAIAEIHWGNGYAEEAARAVLAYGVETLGLKRIIATTLPHNTASQALLAKLGFQHERSMREAEGDVQVELFGRNWPSEAK